LDLAFATKGLRQICEQDARARRDLGVSAAGSLRKRLLDIEAMDALVPELPWLPTMVRSDKIAAVEFHPGFHLVVTPNHGELPLDGDGRVDWTRVERIKLIGIETP
jgi:hypothetical protein